MGKFNAELSSIIPFTEDGCWYFKLIYKYEDEKGKHTVVFPKATVPFSCHRIPYTTGQMSPSARVYALERPYIACRDSMLLYESVCDLASERGVEEPACCFDIITEYASREMTLDEIEKELGYKVKIINKENSNES